MKVNVNVTLDVDPEAWAIEFGLDQADNVIQKDDLPTSGKRR